MRTRDLMRLGRGENSLSRLARDVAGAAAQAFCHWRAARLTGAAKRWQAHARRIARWQEGFSNGRSRSVHSPTARPGSDAE